MDNEICISCVSAFVHDHTKMIYCDLSIEPCRLHELTPNVECLFDDPVPASQRPHDVHVSLVRPLVPVHFMNVRAFCLPCVKKALNFRSPYRLTFMQVIIGQYILT